MVQTHPVKTEFVIPIEPPIFAASDVIGKHFNISVNQRPAVLTFPSSLPPKMTDGPHPWNWPTFPGRPGSHAIERTKNVLFGSGRGGIRTDTDPFEVHAIRIRLNRDPDATSKSESSAVIYREAAALLRIARNWLEAWTRSPQVEIRWAIQPNGIGADFSDGYWSAYFLTGTSVLRNTGRALPDLEVFKTAFLAGSVGTELPLQHQMLVRSEFEYVTLQYRNTVIDACSAAEIALSARIREGLGDQLSRSNTAQASLEGVLGVVELFRIYDAMFGSDVHIGDVKHKLARTRNTAVHTGADPSSGDAKLAIHVAGHLVGESTPLIWPYELRRQLKAHKSP